MDDFWASNPDEEPDWFVPESKDADGEGEGNEEEAEDAAMSSTHHALLLLDAAAPVDTLRASLRTITAVVRQRIRQATTGGGGARNGFGLVLYNTQYRWSAEKDGDKKTKVSSIHQSLDASLEEEEEEEEEDDEEALFLQGTLPHWTNLRTLIPLEPPGVASVQTLQSLTSPEEDEEDKLDSFRPNGTLPVDMGDTVPLPPLLLALREARDVFAQAKCVKKTKRTAATAKRGDLPDVQELWILTDASTDPQNDDEEIQRLLQEAVTDLRDQGVQLHLWALSSGDTASSFLVNNSIVTTVVRKAEEWMQFMSVVYKQTRPVYRVPLLRPDAKATTNMILDVYRLYAAQREPKVLPIHQTTGKILGKVQQLLTLDDGGGHVVAERRSYDPKAPKRPLSTRRQLRTFLEFGSDLIPFSLQDKVNAKKQCNIHPEAASLTLLGFKPTSAIPFYHCIDHSYFATPSATMDEKQHGGNALAHLHAAMLRHDVAAVGELLTRVTATSRLVALRPVPEELRPAPEDDEAWILVQAPGFLLTTLPFEEELRAADVADAPPPEEDLVQATMRLVEKQSFVDAVELGVDFVNAPMDRFWKYMEQIAFGGGGEEKPAAQELYDTEVDAEQVLQHVGEQIQAVAALLPEDTSTAATASSARKRKAAAPPPPDESGIDWLRKVQEGTLSECKVPDLKAKLRSLGESTTGNKPAVRIMHRGECSFVVPSLSLSFDSHSAFSLSNVSRSSLHPLLRQQHPSIHPSERSKSRRRNLILMNCNLPILKVIIYA
jgi:Ku70/Ku80 beta-barrel domain